MPNPKIVIVGAGAAGFAAAARLIEQGMHDVTVLEAKDRVGGRLHTVEFSDNVVDLGGQWVHGEKGNVVFELASPHGLVEPSAFVNRPEAHEFVTISGERMPLSHNVEVMDIYQSISEDAEEVLKDAQGSYGDYFVDEFYRRYKDRPFTDRERAGQYLRWLEKLDDAIQCAETWFDVSAKGVARYRQCPGDPTLTWKDRGYRTLFDLLSKSIPDPTEALPIVEKIQFNKEVSRIDYTGADVSVETKDGSRYVASHVIFTASLGVLKEKHSAIFNPPLPAIKRRAIEGLSIGTVVKIFLEYPHRWWPEDSGGFNFLWSPEDERKFLDDYGENHAWLIDVFKLYSLDYQPRVLCAWVVGKHARRVETMSDAKVLRGLQVLLDAFLGRSYRVPQPVAVIRSKWYSDEHFRGCYSFRSTKTEEYEVEANDLAEPVTRGGGRPLVLFAGEATHDHYYSTVHGAVESGFREADRIINYRRQVMKSSGKPRGSGRTRSSSTANTRTRTRTRTRTKTRTRVAIVGAGIAGLAAAKTLQDQGFTDYLLIEAQDRIGGRVHSVPWRRGFLEYGAQFLHGDGSEMARMCRENLLLSSDLCRDGEGVFLRENGLPVDERIVREVDDLVRDVLEQLENRDAHVNGNDLGKPETQPETVGRTLRREFRKFLEVKNEPGEVERARREVFDWNVRFLTIDNSCVNLDELSAKHWGKFKFVGGPEYLSFNSGYGSLCELLANGSNNKNLLLSTAVSLIEWRGAGEANEEDLSVAPVTLTLSDDSQVHCDCVIITSSLGYLKANHEMLFSPPLPSSLSLAIVSLGFGLINKIFLVFGAPWWDCYTRGFQFLRCEESREASESSNNKLATWTRDLTGFDVLRNHRNVLLGWVGGRGAYLVEKLSERRLALDCERLLRHYLKLDNVPSVKTCRRTRWSANEYVRGSYSHIPARCDYNNVTPGSLAEPVWARVTRNDRERSVPVIMFAGEATHESFYSTTHGAYETGERQARTFLSHHASET